LKNGSANKKSIYLEKKDIGQVDAAQLLSTAHTSLTKLEHKNGGFAKTLLEVCLGLHRFNKAIDVFIKCDPRVATLVLGSVKILLQVCPAANSSRLSRKSARLKSELDS
jgi:hypothetical protein